MRIQIRGNCQCCGRQQAIVRGDMAQHGYTVERGYFEGVCYGYQFSPLQVSRAKADEIIAECRADAVELLALVAAYQSGAKVPGKVKNPSYKMAELEANPMVPYASLNSWQQADALKMAIWNASQRAKLATDFADQLQGLADRLHGTALIEVDVEAKKLARIEGGDQKKLPGGTLVTARYAERGRVVYVYIGSDGKARQGWIGTQSWRKLADA